MSCYFHFTGTPCLRHTNYNFYKSFKYKLSDESKILSLGDFFFLKILQDIPVCIGEIELLWEDKASNQLFGSVRLYFRPEHTPDGRQDDTGEDEILVLGERLVLRLDDLLPLMTEDFQWKYGYKAEWDVFKEEKNGGVNNEEKNNGGVNNEEKNNGGVNNEKNGGINEEENGGIDDEEENGHKALAKEDDQSLGLCKVDSPGSDEDNTPAFCGAANVAVMSFPRYCRYRAMMRRLEGCENKWLRMAVVMALGYFSGKAPGCRVMFCRDTFYHSEIDDLDIRMDHMMPTLKNRPRGKKKKELCRKDSQQDSDSNEEIYANVAPSVSTSSRPRRSTDALELSEDKVNADEQAFLFGLHKFMHDAKIPIGRIPSLGFKQIDLYWFYKHADKLGGYDAITTKRMWKHLYDKMGGNSSNTSAATCTRRHYERLLLPYERHLRKLKGTKNKKKTIRTIEGIELKQDKKEEKENVSQETEVKKKVKEEKISVSSVKVEEKLEGEPITSALPIQDSSGNARGDHKNDTELLEIPMVRQRHQIPKEQPLSSSLDKMKEADMKPFLPPGLAALGLTEQQLIAGAIPGAVQPADFGAAEGTVIPNTNLVYRGGYLVPLHPQQMLQTPWGILAPQQVAPSVKHELEKGGNDRKDHPHSNNNSSSIIPTPAHNGGKSNSHSNPSAVLTPGGMDSLLFPGALSSAGNQQQGGSASSSLLKAAHTNTPYQPSPYLLLDHIQQRPSKPSPSSSVSARNSSLQPQSSQQLHLNQLLASSSQNLIPLLHPTPKGRKSNPSLPPAPSQIYLHPADSNPLSPSLPSPNGAIPPPAHSQPRKRTYPFDHPSQGAFPSPDIVLDRIKSSTVLPGLRTAPGGTPVHRQKFDCPRDIFKQTKQSFAATSTANQIGSSPSSQRHSLQQPHHHATNHQRKPAHQQMDVSNQKRSSSKLKSSSLSSSSSLSTHQRKTPLPTPSSSSSSLSSSSISIPPSSSYHMLPPSALELQSFQMQNAAAAAAAMTNGVGNSSVRDQMKGLPGSNGLLLTDQQALAKAMTSESQLAAAKEGQRLTSALFGAQFTAMPRSSKQSDPGMHPSSSDPMASSSSAAAAAAAAAMSFNPHIHPAFMSPYLPPGVSPAALSPQLQMLAGAYGASPAQFAAYEELLRQNGFGSFLSPGGAPPPKVGKKN